MKNNARRSGTAAALGTAVALTGIGVGMTATAPQAEASPATDCIRWHSGKTGYVLCDSGSGGYRAKLRCSGHGIFGKYVKYEYGPWVKKGRASIRTCGKGETLYSVQISHRG